MGRRAVAGASAENVSIVPSDVRSVVPILVALWRWIVLRATRYELTSQRISLSRGVFSKTRDAMELYRVRDITVFEPFVFRMFGVGNVVLQTSDRTNRTFTFQAVKNPSDLADLVRQNVEGCRMRKGVREIDVE